MKKNNWKRTIAGLLARSTLFSLSLSAASVFAEDTAVEVTTTTEAITQETNVVEIPETDMPILSEGEQQMERMPMRLLILHQRIFMTLPEKQLPLTG